MQLPPELNHPCAQMYFKVYILAFMGVGMPVAHGAMQESRDAPTMFGGPPLPTFPEAVPDYLDAIGDLAESMKGLSALFPGDAEMAESIEVISDHMEQAMMASDFEGVKQAMETPENAEAWEVVLTRFQDHCDKETMQEIFSEFEDLEDEPE